jgi:hypothetical protein
MINISNNPYSNRCVFGNLTVSASSTTPKITPPSTGPHTVPIPPITGIKRIEMLVGKAKTSPG